jgi:hypothetical protein
MHALLAYLTENCCNEAPAGSLRSHECCNLEGSARRCT